ncbi:MAG: AraC family transcriptional regulator, partial [Pseudomonadota bacterium]
RCIVITLEPDKFQRFAEREVGILLATEQLRDLPQFSDPDICQAAVMLMETLASELPGSAVMYESLARIFLVKLIHQYGVERDEEILFSKRFTARHYQRVLGFIAEHFAQVITVEALAKEAGLSPSHFAHVFKATIGVSPMQFVTSYRLEQARKRLADIELPIIDVALACGFSDQAHFSRVFKQNEGLTPSQYRKTLAD